MARIFGIVDHRGECDCEDWLTRIYRRIPSSGRVDHRLRKVFGHRAAFGMTDGDQSLAASMSAGDGGDVLACMIGHTPGIDRFFAGRGLDPSAGAAACVSALYRSDGPGFLDGMPGMFSLAVFEPGSGNLLLASDRSGAFPVYVSRTPGATLFCSSIVPLALLSGTPRVNRGALTEMFLFEALYGSVTCYDGIETVPAGSYLVTGPGGSVARRGRYFEYEGLFDPEEYERNRDIDAPGRLTETMKGALGRILESADSASTGLSCGGGIDCSYIGGVLREIGSSLPIFCSSVAGARVREAEMARTTADALGAEVHTSHLVKEYFYPYLVRSIADFGQPIVHPNTTKFYANADSIHRMERPNQILGVASDLLFGGIGNVGSLYRYQRLRRAARLLPAKARRYAGIAVEDADILDLRLRMRNELSKVARLGMINFERARMQASVERALSAIPGEDERGLKTLMLENLCDYQQHLLHRRSEATASEGITFFYPFLDLEMLRFAVNLPASHSVGWRSSKIAVRKAALRALGEDIAGRAKWGGDVPIEDWLPPLRFLLNGGFVEEELMFETEWLSERAGEDVGFLWNMIDIEIWGRLFLRGEKPGDLVEAMRREGIACADYRP